MRNDEDAVEQQFACHEKSFAIDFDSSFGSDDDFAFAFDFDRCSFCF